MTLNLDDGRTMKQRMLAGDLYHADDAELSEGSQRAIRLQAEFNATYPVDGERASEILADLIGDLGKDVAVKAPLYVDYGSNITIGDGTFVNRWTLPAKRKLLSHGMNGVFKAFPRYIEKYHCNT